MNNWPHCFGLVVRQIMEQSTHLVVKSWKRERRRTPSSQLRTLSSNDLRLPTRPQKTLSLSINTMGICKNQIKRRMDPGDHRR